MQGLRRVGERRGKFVKRGCDRWLPFGTDLLPGFRKPSPRLIDRLPGLVELSQRLIDPWPGLPELSPRLVDLSVKPPDASSTLPVASVRLPDPPSRLPRPCLSLPVRLPKPIDPSPGLAAGTLSPIPKERPDV